MVQLRWHVTAIGAALASSARGERAPRDPAIWGIYLYPLVDHALKKISLMSVLLLTAVPVLLIAPFFYQTLFADYGVWETMETGPTKATFLAPAMTSLIGSVLLFLSISGKNATLASLIADYCGGMNPLQHTGVATII